MRFFFRIMDANLATHDDFDDYTSTPSSVPVPSRQTTKPDLVDENVPPKRMSSKDASQNNSNSSSKVHPVQQKAANVLEKDKASLPVLNEDNKNILPPSSRSPKVKTNAESEKLGVKDNKEKSSKIAGVEKLKNCIVMQYVGSIPNAKPAKQAEPTKTPEFASPKTPAAPSPKSTVAIPSSPPVKAKIDFPSSPEVDMEKSQFLKSIQLTAKSNLSPEKVDTPKVVQPPPPQPFISKIDPTPVKTPTPTKRAAYSPAKSPKKSKVPKKEPLPKKTAAKAPSKSVQNTVVKQMLTNVSQQVSNLRQDVSKILGQNAPPPEASPELKSLFDSCNINIPSSLSITLKETTDDEHSSKTPTSIKPVQNYIEILKLPEVEAPVPAKNVATQKTTHVQSGHENVPNKESKVSTSTAVAGPPKEVTSKACSLAETKSPSPSLLMSLGKPLKVVNSIEPTQDQSKKTATLTSTPNLAQLLQNTPHALPKNASSHNGTNKPISNESASKSFQKMFEEAVKNDFNKVVAFPTERTKKSDTAKAGKQQNVLDLSTGSEGHMGGHHKRNIAEIAQQLYKKTKMEQEKQLNNNQAPVTGSVNGKVPIPRLTAPRGNTPQPIQTFQSYVSQQRGQTQTPPNNIQPKSPQKVPPPPIVAAAAIQNTPSPSPILKSPNGLSPKAAPNQLALSPKCAGGSPLGDLSPSQLLEKYNIPNLAQLSANFNLAQAGHFAALQQAFVLKQFEMQNRQNWLKMNPNLAVQYEKLFQNLSSQGHTQLLGNKSEH